MIDKKIDEKEAQDLKKTRNHYLDERTEIMKNTEYKAEDALGDILGENSIPRERIAKLNDFSAERM